MGPRIVAGVIGVFFLLQAIQWIVMPERAAEGLGMPLLDGLGRSTQVGDFSAFFLALGLLPLLGARTGQAHWLQAAALLLGSAAVLRTTAWAVHGADFATQFIAAEILCAGALLFAASRFAKPPGV